MYRGGLMFDNPTHITTEYLKYTGAPQFKPGMTKGLNWQEYGDVVSTQVGQVSLPNNDITLVSGVAGHNSAQTPDDVKRTEFNLKQIPMILARSKGVKNLPKYIISHDESAVGGATNDGLADINAIQDPVPFSSTDYPWMEGLAAREPKRARTNVQSASYALNLAPDSARQQYQMQLQREASANRIVEQLNEQGISRQHFEKGQAAKTGNLTTLNLQKDVKKEKNTKDSTTQATFENPVFQEARGGTMDEHENPNESIPGGIGGRPGGGGGRGGGPFFISKRVLHGDKLNAEIRGYKRPHAEPPQARPHAPPQRRVEGLYDFGDDEIPNLIPNYVPYHYIGQKRKFILRDTPKKIRAVEIPPKISRVQKSIKRAQKARHEERKETHKRRTKAREPGFIYTAKEGGRLRRPSESIRASHHDPALTDPHLAVNRPTRNIHLDPHTQRAIEQARANQARRTRLAAERIRNGRR